MQHVKLILGAAIIVLTLAVVSCGGAPAPATGAQSASKDAAKPAAAKTLDFAYIPAPDSVSKALEWMSKEATQRSAGALQVNYYQGTLLTKEAEIVDAVKSGNIALGTPAAAAGSMFPEINVLMAPYLLRGYDHTYRVLNGEIGKQLAAEIESKYKVKVVFWYDFGFRHFFNTKRPITKPEDLKGLKMRTPQNKIFSDTVNAFGGSAVPMSWGEVIPAIQQGVLDGADQGIANIKNNKVYEIAKYVSLTYHASSPTFVIANPGIWNSLTPDQQKLLANTGMEAQKRLRDEAESVESIDGAKRTLEPLGMVANAPDLEPFRKIVQEKLWPDYKKQYGAQWDKIVAVQ